MANINKIKLSGTTYNIQDLSAAKSVELTQAQYDALTVKDPNTFYIITDSQGADLSNYYTKSETSGATEISTALNAKQDTLVSGTNIKTINNESILGSGNITIQGGGGTSYSAGTGIDITNDVISVTGKVDTTTYNTYTAATDTALASKQTTLTAGTGIDITDNVISATGGGGGGKAINAGTNISVTTGETADTINCTLPITVSSIKYYFGENNTIGSSHRINYGFIFGAYNTVNGIDSRNEYYHYIIGNNNTDYGAYNTIIGAYNTVKNRYPYGTLNSILIGDNNVSSADTSYNVSNRILIGSHLSCLSNGEIALGRYNISTGDTLFSIGDGNYFEHKHNAFEIKNNGDIYIVDTNDTSTTSYYQKPMIKLQDTITATAANTTALGGLKLVKLTQSEYDALSTKDSNTLYVIVN